MPFSINNTVRIATFLLLLLALVNCGNSAARSDKGSPTGPQPADNGNRPIQARDVEPPVKNNGKVIHVLVALCDNVNQGIVPVPARLGNGEDLKDNLYWGAAYGVKSFFAKSKDWKLVAQMLKPQPAILERCLFKHKTRDVYLVADAYRGAEIKQTISDFFDYAAGGRGENLRANEVALRCGDGADLLVYVGHNGLMDFNLATQVKQQDDKRRDAIMLCCASKNYFAARLRSTGANPLLWTTNLMAPEAYILQAAINGWLQNESGEQIRLRAAEAYHKYQRCGLKAARNLFSSSW
jgi:hypothetical protein